MKSATPVDYCFILIFYLSITLLNLVWVNEVACAYQYIDYCKILVWPFFASFIFMFLGVITGKRMISICIFFCYIIFIEANLIYLRTFDSWIPLGSYSEVFNIFDFLDAVIYNIKIQDLLIISSTIILIVIVNRLKFKKIQFHISAWVNFLVLIILGIVTVAILNSPTSIKGQITINSKQHNSHPMSAAYFSIPVVLAYDYLQIEQITPGSIKIAKAALSHRLEKDSIQSDFKNLIFIFMESLESWALKAKVGEKEVAPVLNHLINDKNNLCCTDIISETGSGRSIDAQLITLCGLLPPKDEIFCFKYTGTEYPSIYHAFKQTSNFAVHYYSTDLPSTYNMEKFHSKLGIDSTHFFSSRKINRTRIQDADLIDKVIADIENNNLWHKDKSNVFQILTYSCHTPYKTFSEADMPIKEKLPKNANNYLKLVHYTDSAVGIFMNYLSKKADFDKTLVVIASDHPTFSIWERKYIAEIFPDANKSHIPVIIVNGNKSQNYSLSERCHYQSDIYPTLILLLNLYDYNWHGVGYPLMDNTACNEENKISASKLIIQHNLYKKQHTF